MKTGTIVVIAGVVVVGVVVAVIVVNSNKKKKEEEAKAKAKATAGAGAGAKDQSGKPAKGKAGNELIKNIGASLLEGAATALKSKPDQSAQVQPSADGSWEK